MKVLTKWRVAGATLVAIPAFADVSITLDPLPAEPVEGTEVEPAAPSEPEYDSMWASASPPWAEQSTTPLPPLAWFMKPDVDRLTPLTVSDTGVTAHFSTKNASIPAGNDDPCFAGL